MTWLAGLPFKQPILLGEDSQPPVPAPDWAAFMVYLGWTIASIPAEDRKLYCFVLLPERVCCSSLIALGAFLYAVARTPYRLDWPELSSLPEGHPIYFRFQHSGKTELCSGHTAASAFPGMVAVNVEQPRRWVLHVPERGFERYLFQTKSFPSNLKHGGLDRIGRLLAGLLEGYDPRWTAAAGASCLVVTNLAAWRRENEDLIIAAGSKATPMRLFDLLRPTTATDERPGSVLYSSPGDRQPNTEGLRVAVLDGPRAFLSNEAIATPRVIGLLQEHECDDECVSGLARLASLRDEALLTDHAVMPRVLRGVDLSLFAIRR